VYKTVPHVMTLLFVCREKAAVWLLCLLLKFFYQQLMYTSVIQELISA